MKIRLGFVTNSSSSSFIMGFKQDEDIYETVKEAFPSYVKEEYIQDVVDVIEENKCSLFKAAQYYADYRASYNATEEEIEKYKTQFIDSFKNQFESFSIPEFSDNDGEFWSDVEHEFAQNMSCTIMRMSHH